jgi:GNAT superfamily N-acetyltransferase
LLENNDTAIGYARLKVGQPAPGVTSVRPIEIVRLYVRQDWLGKGVGARLMQACLDEAVKQGCDTVWLDVWNRTRAHEHSIANGALSKSARSSFNLATICNMI